MSHEPELPALIEGQDIVCVSVMDWDWPFWTSRQHLMREFARTNRVLFVDPPMTYASDYRAVRHDPRLRRKAARSLGFGRLQRVERNILSWCPPPAIPFNRIEDRSRFETLLAFNQGVFRASLQRALIRVGMQDPILWISFNVYFGEAIVGRLGEQLSVYHCTDEVSGFPGYSSRVSELEARLASQSDLVITTSEVLRDAKAQYNPRTHFVPNAAEVDLFQSALSWDGPEPEDLRRIPQPRAGFVGQIEYRFDGELLQSVAARMPDWHFVLIGPVQPGNSEVEALRRCPNVHFLGLKARTELPGYLAGLQVGLIPYRINQLTRGIYPLKVHEYLAAGKPVVATPIPSLSGLVDDVLLADDAPAFAAAIRRAAAEDSPEAVARRSQRAEAENWRARATDISRLMREVRPIGGKVSSGDPLAAGSLAGSDQWAAESAIPIVAGTSVGRVHADSP